MVLASVVRRGSEQVPTSPLGHLSWWGYLCCPPSWLGTSSASPMSELGRVDRNGQSVCTLLSARGLRMRQAGPFWSNPLGARLPQAEPPLPV